MLPLTPSATFTVEACGGKFTFRHPTAKQYVEAFDLDTKERLDEFKNLKALLAGIVAVLTNGLVGWELATGAEPVPFDPAKLPEVLTFDEIWQLYYAWRHGSRQQPNEKKGSASA